MNVGGNIKRWRLLPAPVSACQRLQRELGIGPLAARVLVARGYDDPSKARPVWEGREPLHDPYLLPDMEVAVDRIRRALRRGERILIVGDYDVDGVAAAALLYRGLRGWDPHASVEVYIPHRHREGYGVPPAAVERAQAIGATLLITVDNGIAAHSSLAMAAAKGIDVIVTDHHEPQGTLPPAMAVVNPRRADSSYPDAHLSGTGVAFKLLQALAGEEPDDPAWWQLAALATVADVVPLQGENRLLVRQGLRALAASPLVGLAALAEVAGLPDTRLEASTLAFVLAPRLNAAGRMESAQQSWELLTTSSPDRARALALAADQLNQVRRQQEQRVLDQALARLERGEGLFGDGVILMADPQWHQGVLGIVAARLVELFHRPALVGRQIGRHVTGSGRSIQGFHLFEALHRCRDLLDRFGGHASAAGFTLAADRLEPLGRQLASQVTEVLGPEERIPQLTIDAVVRPGELTVEAVAELERLGPFGEGNPEPILALVDVPPPAVRVVGETGHHLRLEWPGAPAAVAFGWGSLAGVIGNGRPLEVAVRARVGEFQGQRRVDLHVLHIRPVEAGRPDWLRVELERRRHHVDQLYPDRQLLVQVYMALERLAAPDRTLGPGSGDMVGRLQRLLPRQGRATLQAALEVLREAGVLAPIAPDRWRLAERGARTFDLQTSARYREGQRRRRLLDRLHTALAEGRWREVEEGLAHPLAVVVPPGYNNRSKPNIR